MPYTINVPKGTDVISQSQKKIEDNFQSITDLIAVNHTTFNSSSVGLHNIVTFVQQQVDPVTTNTHMALYSKETNNGNVSELFVRYPSNGRVMQVSGMTDNGQVDTSGNQFIIPGGYYNGFQYLSGGMLMKWGYANFPSQGSVTLNTYTINFPVDPRIPEFKTVPVHLEVQSLLSNNPLPSGIIYSSIISQTQYSIRFQGASDGLNSSSLWYMAIGT